MKKLSEFFLLMLLVVIGLIAAIVLFWIFQQSGCPMFGQCVGVVQ